jgi:transcriptional regulator with XRE-family HTH domain
MKEIRQEKGIQLTALSAKTGISIGYLCHLEKGTRTNPSADIMEKIAKGLEKTVVDVFFK